MTSVLYKVNVEQFLPIFLLNDAILQCQIFYYSVKEFGYWASGTPAAWFSVSCRIKMVSQAAFVFYKILK